MENQTFKMYHGGKRWQYVPREILPSTKGRYEGGVGIYFTNDYMTASKYAKGGRVVHLVELNSDFVELSSAKIPLIDMVNFVKNLSGLKKKKEIVTDIINNAKRMNSDMVRADVLNNLVVNYEVGAGKVGVEIAKYFVSHGIDAYVEKKSGDEFWVVVFNTKMIKSVRVVNPKEKIEFMLPKPKEIQ